MHLYNSQLKLIDFVVLFLEFTFNVDDLVIESFDLCEMLRRVFLLVLELV
jgi:hypothetical protein